ncbi:MAG: D-glycero-beta-D-manno-heptose 1-phosphate adenylyltransferase [Candidatus Kapaibacteriales bacterium]
MIVSINEIGSICESIRSISKIIVFTNGCFDILHFGHVLYLKQAKALGDILIVGLNSDSSVRRIKGSKRPITPEIERAEILDTLKPVDYVVIFEEDTPEYLIRIVKPDFLVKGGDYNVENIVGARFVQTYGGKVVTIPYVQGNSTTNIIQKIKNL